MKKRKGFTLVELLVVIAILAILATVSIVGYTSFIKKANVSNDNTLIGELNMFVQAANVNDEINTPSDAAEALEEEGFYLNKLEPSTDGYHYGYDVVAHKFCLLDADYNIVSDYTPAKAENLFAFVNSSADFDKAKTKYSVYLQSGFAYDGTDPLTVSKGIDTGDKEVNVTYSHTSGSAQEVTIRSNGQECVVTVDGLGGTNGDTVNHYGYASFVYVNSVDTDDCYNEYGTVKTLQATAGKINVGSTGILFNVVNAVGSTATFGKNQGNVMNADSGTFTSSSVFSINNYDQFIAFRDATNSGENFKGITVELNCDITLTGAWRPISDYNRNDAKQSTRAKSIEATEAWFAGIFDGKNHTISGLTNNGYPATNLNVGHNSTTPNGANEFCYGLFASVNSATIKNLNLTSVNIVKYSDTNTGIVSEAVGALVGYVWGDSTIENISVSGKIDADNVVGGVVGMAREGTILIKDCENSATITSKNRAAGIVCGISTEKNQITDGTHVTVQNCKNYGTVTTTRTEADANNCIAGIAGIQDCDNCFVELVNNACEASLLVGTANTIKGSIAFLQNINPRVAINENGSVSVSVFTKASN